MDENNQIQNPPIGFTYIKPQGFMTAPWLTNHECFTKEEIDTLNQSLEKYRQGYHDAKIGGGETQDGVVDGKIRRTQVAFLNYADQDPILVDFFTKICTLVDEVNMFNFGFSVLVNPPSSSSSMAHVEVNEEKESNAVSLLTA